MFFFLPPFCILFPTVPTELRVALGQSSLISVSISWSISRCFVGSDVALFPCSSTGAFNFQIFTFAFIFSARLCLVM